MPALAAPVMRQPVTRPLQRSSMMAWRVLVSRRRSRRTMRRERADLDQAAAAGRIGKPPAMVRSFDRDVRLLVGGEHGVGRRMLQDGGGAGAERRVPARSCRPRTM